MLIQDVNNDAIIYIESKLSDEDKIIFKNIVGKLIYEIGYAHGRMAVIKDIVNSDIKKQGGK